MARVIELSITVYEDAAVDDAGRVTSPPADVYARRCVTADQLADAFARPPGDLIERIRQREQREAVAAEREARGGVKWVR